MKNKIQKKYLFELNKKKILIILLFVLITFIFMHLNERNNFSEQKNIGTKLGQFAPDFQTEYLNGDKFKLSELRGQPVILNFWATWCPPCIKEMPLLQKLYDEGNIIVIGVNLQEDKKTIGAFIKKLNVTFPIVLDEEGSAKAMYNIILKPATYFIDKNGIVADKKYGELSREDLKQRSRKLSK